MKIIFIKNTKNHKQNKQVDLFADLFRVEKYEKPQKQIQDKNPKKVSNKQGSEKPKAKIINKTASSNIGQNKVTNKTTGGSNNNAKNALKK